MCIFANSTESIGQFVEVLIDFEYFQSRNWQLLLRQDEILEQRLFVVGDEVLLVAERYQQQQLGDDSLGLRLRLPKLTECEVCARVRHGLETLRHHWRELRSGGQRLRCAKGRAGRGS